MRGIMNFDDYNYNAINDYVLITATDKKVKNKKIGSIGDIGVELSEQNLSEAGIHTRKF